MLAGFVAARGALKPGMDVEQARDIAFIVTNVESYLQFTDVCGWIPRQERTACWLGRRKKFEQAVGSGRACSLQG
ncbi:hypothetical protein [Dactylosporangium sp. NPDC005555]|uniref:hypothetical protein n=1 Tax=Dactylosporangium sp. NPDC005555 TaxID=3154889 RepID=UPI00339DBAC6